MGTSALLAWTIGYPELLILGFLVLIIFGNRLPSVMRSMGRGIVEFKKGVKGIEEDVEGEPKSS